MSKTQGCKVAKRLCSTGKSAAGAGFANAGGRVGASGRSNRTGRIIFMIMVRLCSGVSSCSRTGKVNEKPFATTLFTQLHCEGLFNIKGEYENLIERKGDGGKSIAVFRLH